MLNEMTATKLKRVSEACLSCRVRKKRCDGVKPKCGSCKDPADCVWENKKQKRGPTKSQPKYHFGNDIILMNFIKSILESLPIDQWPVIHTNQCNSIVDFPGNPATMRLWYSRKLFERAVGNVPGKPTSNDSVGKMMNLQLLRTDALVEDQISLKEVADTDVESAAAETVELSNESVDPVLKDNHNDEVSRYFF